MMGMELASMKGERVSSVMISASIMVSPMLVVCSASTTIGR